MAIIKIFVYALIFLTFLHVLLSNIIISHQRKNRTHDHTYRNCDEYKITSQSNILFLFLFMSITCLFRFAINPQSIPDTWYYANNFSTIGKLSWESIIKGDYSYYDIEDEIGFVIISKALYFITSNVYVYIGLIGVIITVCYYELIKNNSPIIWLSCLLFLIISFNQSLFVLRQYLAMGIAYYSLPFIMSRDFKKFFLIIFIAFLFHRTAMVFLPLYFLYGINNKLRMLLICIIVVTGIKISISILLNYVLIFYSDLQGYANEEDGANIKNTLFIIIILLVRLLFMKKQFWNNGINRLFSSILICAVSYSILSYGLGFDRIVVYFSSLLCVVIPQMIIEIKNKFVKYAFAILFIIVQIYLWNASLIHITNLKLNI